MLLYMRRRGQITPACSLWKVSKEFILLPGSPISLHCRDPKVAEVRVAHSTALAGNTVAENIVFTSSSAAARFVCGNPGTRRWCGRTGKVTYYCGICSSVGSLS